MKRMLVLFLVLLLGAPALAVAAPEGKIGYIDLQKALNVSEAGKNAKEKIAGMVKQHETTVENRQKELKKLKDDLDKQAMLLSEEARASKERDYQQKLRDFQRMTKDIQEELQQADADHTRQIIEGLLKVVKEIGDKEGYALILELTEGSIVYADPKLDITDKAIKAYDARQRTGK
jgi:outer membrane protein